MEEPIEILNGPNTKARKHTKKRSQKIADKEATEHAAEIIKNILSDGPVPAIDVISTFEEEGISPEAVISAKRSLIISNIMINGKRHWMLG